jgi:hypothetical protein
MAINYTRLVRLCESRERAEEAFAARAVRPQDLDLGRLFAECFGWANFQACRSREQTANDVISRALTESNGAVMATSFLNVQGQFVYQTVLDAYQLPEFVFTKLIPEAQASTLDGEKIPGITEIGDELAVRKETDPYALAGVGENWIFTPQIPDRGMEVPVTWEALFQDKTGRLAERCADVGKWAGQNVEKRAIDCVIDENTTAHQYNWRGTVIASYNDNTGSHTWDNLQASNAITDWTSLNAAEQLFNQLVDPFTGEPISVEPRHLVVTKQNEQTARRVVSATEIRVITPGYATSGAPTQTNMPNPYNNKYEVVTSKLLYARVATKTNWYLGDVSKYAKRMVAEKMRVLPLPPNNPDEIRRRIVQSYVVNERSAFVVVEPRAVVKNTA